MVVTGWRSAGQSGLGERGPTIKRPTRMTPDPAPVRDEALAVWNDALVRLHAGLEDMPPTVAS
jgi:hypothetical protein